MNADQRVREELAERGLGLEHYVEVWERQNLPAPRDLPERPASKFNDRAWELENLLHLPVPALSTIDHAKK